MRRSGHDGTGTSVKHTPVAAAGRTGARYGLTNPHLSHSEAVTSTEALPGDRDKHHVQTKPATFGAEGKGPEPCPTRLQLTSPCHLLPEPGGQVSDVHIFTPHARLSADHPILLLRAACRKTQCSGDGVAYRPPHRGARNSREQLSYRGDNLPFLEAPPLQIPGWGRAELFSVSIKGTGHSKIN